VTPTRRSLPGARCGVLQVGMDVADASVMIVHHPERFGMSVLHQLRGRVGRSGRASKCFLVNSGGEASREKLQLLVDEHDGLRIAQADLAHRWPPLPCPGRGGGARPDPRGGVDSALIGLIMGTVVSMSLGEVQLSQHSKDERPQSSTSSNDDLRGEIGRVARHAWHPPCGALLINVTEGILGSGGWLPLRNRPRIQRA
jgi:hypothetical protein